VDVGEALVAANGDRPISLQRFPGDIEGESVGDPWADLGELPFPPDYPKMPGEPPRVQPSRARNPKVVP
jgi:hypothetical protein